MKFRISPGHPSTFIRLELQDRQIALHYAAANGHGEVVKCLVHQDGNQLMSLVKMRTKKNRKRLSWPKKRDLMGFNGIIADLW